MRTWDSIVAELLAYKAGLQRELERTRERVKALEMENAQLRMIPKLGGDLSAGRTLQQPLHNQRSVI
jgi:predicted nuclease with TOPRIM domain